MKLDIRKTKMFIGDEVADDLAPIEDYADGFRGTYVAANPSTTFIGNTMKLDSGNYLIKLKFKYDTFNSDTTIKFTSNSEVVTLTKKGEDFLDGEWYAEHMITVGVNDGVVISFENIGVLDFGGWIDYVSFKSTKWHSLDIPEQDILINKSIKDHKDPNKIYNAYSNNFNVYMTQHNKDVLGHIDKRSNSRTVYETILTDDTKTILQGHMKMNDKHRIIDGIMVYNAVLFDAGVALFNDLKTEYMVNLQDNSDYKSSYTSTVNDSNIDKSLESFAETKGDFTKPYHYAMVDNGQLHGNNAFGFASGTRHINATAGMITTRAATPVLGDISSVDIYPAPKVAVLWEEMFKQHGFNYEGDFFNTDEWWSLTLNNYASFKYDRLKQDDEVANDLRVKKSEASFDFNHPVDFITRGDSYYLDSLRSQQVTFLENGANGDGSTYFIGEFTADGLEVATNRIAKGSFNAQLQITLDTGFANDVTSPDNEIAGFMLTGGFAVTVVGESNNTTLHRSDHPFAISSAAQHATGLGEGIMGGTGTSLMLSEDVNINVEFDYSQIIPNEVYRVYITSTRTTPEIVEWTTTSKTYKYPEIAYSIVGTGTLSLELHDRIAFNEEFNLKHVVDSKLKQHDFLSGVISLYNLRYDYDYTTNTFKFYTFDEYYIKESSILKVKPVTGSTKISVGNDFQTNKTEFSFKETKTLATDAYNEANEIDFAKRIIKTEGNLKGELTSIKNKIGLAPYVLHAIDIPVTSNVNDISNGSLNGTAKLNNVTYFGYHQPVNTTQALTYVRGDLTYDKTYAGVGCISPLFGLYTQDTDKLGSTLEFLPSKFYHSTYKLNDINDNYKNYYETEYTDILRDDAEIWEVDAYLSEMPKMNDIVNIEEHYFRIENIKGFSKRSKTRLTLIKVSFNPNFPGTSEDTFPIWAPVKLSSGFQHTSWQQGDTTNLATGLTDYLNGAVHKGTINSDITVKFDSSAYTVKITNSAGKDTGYFNPTVGVEYNIIDEAELDASVTKVYWAIHFKLEILISWGEGLQFITYAGLTFKSDGYLSDGIKDNGSLKSGLTGYTNFNPSVPTVIIFDPPYVIKDPTAGARITSKPIKIQL